MGKKVKIIKFEKFLPEFLDLQSSKPNIPKWYKDLPEYNGPDIWIDKSIKFCMPFLDSLTSGYMIPLQVDVHVKQIDGNPLFTWGNGNLEIVHIRSEKDAFIPVPPGYSLLKPAWKLPLALELPKGYSMLVTHPLNRFDLPFITVSAIIDDFKQPNGSMPFMIKKGFEGLIEAGTPIAQIIPFKRENWKKENSPGLKEASLVNGFRSIGSLRGWYKHTFWKRKTYE